ncbi:YlbL family protein [Sinomonas atrocyanea]|uniref:YlbL family protein n=1 Tax=Sinomonas atrocyanea TaxID=37927 RepID=UPI003D980543
MSDLQPAREVREDGVRASADETAPTGPGPFRTNGGGRSTRDGAQIGRGFAALMAGVATLVLGATVMSVPVPFVVGVPGPTYNALGSADGKEVISVAGHDTYPASGALDLTTVYMRGGPASDVGLVELARSWFDSSREILPEDVVYPKGVTRQQISDENAAQMDDSQHTAVAAALRELGVPFEQQLNVGSVPDGSPSSGKLRAGDRLLKVGGRAADTLPAVQEAVAAGQGAPVEVVVLRDGAQVTQTITPTNNSGRWLLGIGIRYSFTFPFTVDVQLSNVGGPSAGMMFALAIYDKLTPGDLTGGKHIAGTGTIGPDGRVGSIGGIAQKLHGARDAGATLFLAPAGNCDEVAGHIPDGLAVVKVSTLGDARTAVEGYARGEDPAGMPQCTAQ